MKANITERGDKADSSFTTLCRDEGDVRLKNDRNVVGERAATLQDTRYKSRDLILPVE